MTPLQQKIAFSLFKEKGVSKQNVIIQSQGKQKYYSSTILSWKEVLDQFDIIAKYTIVYQLEVIAPVQAFVEIKLIECKPELLHETVKKEIGWSNVWFVLEGHCKIVNT